MKHGTSRHPKLLGLARTLGISRREAVGLLELLWEYVCDYAPAGDIGKFPDAGIAAAVEWEGDPAALIGALVLPCGPGCSGWLNRCFTHRLTVHDWQDHAPDYIRKRLLRQKQGFVQTTAENVQTTAAVVQTSADKSDLAVPLCPPVQPNHALANPTEPSLTEPTTSSPALPVGFAEFWKAYPKKVGKAAALKEWKKAKDKPTIEVILKSLALQVLSEGWRKEGGQYIPDPERWIKKGRWADEVQTVAGADEQKAKGNYGY